jgi:small subunit ribosomal protein S17
MGIKERGQPKRMIGTVVSAKTDKTRSVVVEQHKKDPLYGKYIRIKRKFMAHDSNNLTHEGDRVEIVACRPVSKAKCWRVTRVLRLVIAEPAEQEGQVE